MLKVQRKGFVLIEAITSLMISVMIIFTLTYCVNEQFHLLSSWEDRVNAHKIILLHLETDNLPNPIMIKNKKYFYEQQDNKYLVKVNGYVYQIEK